METCMHNVLITQTCVICCRYAQTTETSLAAPTLSRDNPWRFLTAFEIFKWYGERCPSTEPGCPVCAAWLRHDMLKQWEFEDINSRIDLAKDEAEGWGCMEEVQPDEDDISIYNQRV